MKPLALEETRQAVNGTYLARGQDTEFTSVTTDSRSAAAGQLFIALKGERFDGHDFLPQVAAAGCAGAIVSSSAKLPAGVEKLFAAGVIAVADTQKALENLGCYHRKICKAVVVAVTGSNGKTTTKRMIHHILSRRLRGSCSPKSFNNNIGVPLTLLGVNSDDQYVICEVGSNAPGEIAALGRIVQPDIAVITSVGSTHLERLGSIQGVAAEKASLLGCLSGTGKAIVWGDSKELAGALTAYHCPMVRFGAAADCDLRLTARQSHGLSQRFEIGGQTWVDLPMAGAHNASNALAAIAVAMEFGFTIADAAAALKDFSPTQGRLETLECGPITLINDAYNANPTSMLAAASALADCRDAARRVMIVGDMLELGASSKQLHEQTGRQIAQYDLDVVIGVGNLGRHIAAGANSAAGKKPLCREFETMRQAQEQAPSLLAGGDLVLIKGSRGMAMERLIDPIRKAFAGDCIDSSKGAPH